MSTADRLQAIKANHSNCDPAECEYHFLLNLLTIETAAHITEAEQAEKAGRYIDAYQDDSCVLQKIADLAWLWNTNRLGDKSLALEITKLVPERNFEWSANINPAP